MFTTFSADSLRQEERLTATMAASNSSNQKRQSQLDHQSLTGSSSPTVGSASAARPKRIQVARACEWCRLNRIKCDDSQPCNACQSRGAECSNTGKSGLRSLPTATKQVITPACMVCLSLTDNLKRDRETRSSCKGA